MVDWTEFDKERPFVHWALIFLHNVLFCSLKKNTRGSAHCWNNITTAAVWGSCKFEGGGEMVHCNTAPIEHRVVGTKRRRHQQSFLLFLADIYWTQNYGCCFADPGPRKSQDSLGGRPLVLALEQRVVTDGDHSKKAKKYKSKNEKQGERWGGKPDSQYQKIID